MSNVLITAMTKQANKQSCMSTHVLVDAVVNLNGCLRYDEIHMAGSSTSWPNQFHLTDQVPPWQHHCLSADKNV